MRRLILIFAVRTCPKVRFLTLRHLLTSLNVCNSAAVNLALCLNMAYEPKYEHRRSRSNYHLRTLIMSSLFIDIVYTIHWWCNLATQALKRLRMRSPVWAFVARIWATPSEKAFSSMRKMHIQVHPKSHPGIFSLDTFYSVQWIYNRTANALIRLRGYAGWSGHSLCSYVRRQVFTWRGPYDVRNRIWYNGIKAFFALHIKYRYFANVNTARLSVQSALQNCYLGDKINLSYILISQRKRSMITEHAFRTYVFTKTSPSAARRPKAYMDCGLSD